MINAIASGKLINSILDFDTRTSDKAAYKAPEMVWLSAT
jgi:hypothetical protein